MSSELFPRASQGITRPFMESFTGEEMDQETRENLNIQRAINEIRFALKGTKIALPVTEPQLALPAPDNSDYEDVRKWISRPDWLQREDQERERLTRYVRTGTFDDYQQWLIGYIQSERPISFMNQRFYDDFYHVATTDLVLPPLHGTNALKLIVPRDIQVDYHALGHNAIFYMAGYRLIGKEQPAHYKGMQLPSKSNKIFK